ncbi:phage major capsid family protein [Microaceticoccus formicicus]|uniref:phage major capsid family protein n=1 Tax=Microaceticoccus formicicus TaxID=3118105 RepID=UPI003CD0144E|nr:phage major capsid protein [Peptoniphilaceae bacterium AMB_02]
MAVLSKGNLFDPVIVQDLVSKVKGHSSLAVLSAKEPLSFNGNKEFIFTMDSEVDIVAENGKKSHGGVKIEPKIVTPLKVEYGARVSDEFIYASEEEQINILKAFNDGFAKKVARGLDLMAMHGVNPRTGTASTVIGTNHFDATITQTVTFDAAQVEENIEAAVAMIQGADGDVTGMAMAPAFSGALATLKVNGVKQYPELAWGSNPAAINGLKVDINRTISDGTDVKDRAIIGDFQDMFSWGYAKEIPLEVIKYGDPDNSGNDLKGYNQVYLRAEVYLGWGILDADSFVRIVTV